MILTSFTIQSSPVLFILSLILALFSMGFGLAIFISLFRQNKKKAYIYLACIILAGLYALVRITSYFTCLGIAVLLIWGSYGVFTYIWLQCQV
ncbi:hypothetical protein WMZ97_20285 [Lentibacillus sp. N15]|uniref:hypothetical protein n=1 Tax=Lentibacillus songyuanensis TaxID=3136161 RepID=UPI0031BB4E07